MKGDKPDDDDVNVGLLLLAIAKVSNDQIVECRDRARRVRGKRSEGGGHLPHFDGF